MTPSSGTPGKWLVVAMLACTFNILSLFLLNYQNYVVDIALQHRALTMKYPYHADSIFPPPVIQFLYSAPIAVVVIFRRTAAISGAYFGILFTILVGRSYYLAQFYLAGLDAVSKFDWAALFATVLGTASVAILAVWMLFRFTSLIRGKLKPGTRVDSDE